MKKTQEQAKLWLIAKLGKKLVKQFNGHWCAIAAGEVLYQANPRCKEKTLIWPEKKESCGYNGGCAIFHTGNGFSILSCDIDLYRALSPKMPGGASISEYNNGVKYDTEDLRILKMSVLCKNYPD